MPRKVFNQIKTFILSGIVFLFPFFFLTTTQEYYSINKFYLLSFGAIFLLVISAVRFMLVKKISWERKNFDSAVFLFLTTTALSVVMSSTNKFQALVNPNFGFILFLSLSIIYFYLSREKTLAKIVAFALKLSLSTLSIVTIILFFNPLRGVSLPQSLSFLKVNGFTSMGGQLSLVLFLGFGLSYQLAKLIENNFKKNKNLLLDLIFTVLNIVAFSLTVYLIIDNLFYKKQSLFTSSFTFPPYRLSWYASVETLKRPLTALFGVGLGNFSYMFNLIKDGVYNTSQHWQISSFSVGHSAVLQIMTEGGLFMLVSFFLLMFVQIRLALKQKKLGYIFTTIYLSLAFFLFPPSVTLFFLMFINLSYLEQVNKENDETRTTLDLSRLVPVFSVITFVFVAVIAIQGYVLVRNYQGEYYFKQALNETANNKILEARKYLKKAIKSNPYIERYHVSLSQNSLLIANNIASAKKGKISKKDSQIISQAVQEAISEAKAVISLNPNKSFYWENLGMIYKNILNLVQNADKWSISAYQRAVVLDPKNPLLRLRLGQIYFINKDYNQATQLFVQAIDLKPDFANGYYNLAWANFKKQDYKNAVLEMKNVLKMINEKTSKSDYEKAKKDLATFRKKLPKEKSEEGQQATGEANKKPVLNLPQTSQPIVTPKIKIKE